MVRIMQVNNSSKEKIRTKISKGYQVVFPSQLRKRYKVSVGDEVLWEISNKGVSIQVHKKPARRNCWFGSWWKRTSSVELKKKIQREIFESLPRFIIHHDYLRTLMTNFITERVN